ncbi:hypothetical protein D3C86_351310 [compost metagenome]
MLIATQYNIPDVTGELSNVPRYFEFSGNIGYRLFSYSLYGILPRGGFVTNNWHIYSPDPIINCGTEVYPDNSRFPGIVVDGNVAYADPALANTSIGFGMALRNASHTRITNNLIFNYGNGLQITPNASRIAPNSGTISTSAVSRDITFDGNSIVNYRGVGVQLTRTSGDGSIYANVYDVSIRNNLFNLVLDDANVLSTGSVISVVFTGGSLVNNISIDGNIADGAGSYMVSVSGIRGLYIRNNRMKNPGRTVAGQKVGLNLSDVVGYEIVGNEFKDDRGVPVMTVTLSGNNTTTKGIMRNNSFLGWTSAMMTQITPASHKSCFDNNKSGDDALDGIITLSAAGSTVVANTNAHSGGAYQRYVTLTPINNTSAQMTAKRPYISSQVSGVSFTITTGDGSAAAGTEQFYYKING